MFELRDVVHRFGERQVLDGVTVSLHEHRIGVIGANGSGKSTLARLLNGLVVPTAGTVTFDGLDTRTQGRAVRRRVGFVFTDPDAQIVMPTVAEDVAFSLRGKGFGVGRDGRAGRVDRAETAQRVQAALERFGLADHHDHPAHSLSGGQKQLLALTSVLVSEPEVLVCDEPTTLLDLRNTARVGRLLAGLSQQVVLVTHDLDLLTGWERVLVVDQGRVVADAPADEAIAVYRRLALEG